MKRWLFAIIVMIPCFIFAQDTGSKKLPYYLPQTEHDFGTMVEGADAMHDFVILNKGDDVLSIHDVKTG